MMQTFHTLAVMGQTEVILILVVVLILFVGPKKLPELARSIGKSINEFRKGQREGAEIDAPKEESKKEERPDE